MERVRKSNSLMRLVLLVLTAVLICLGLAYSKITQKAHGSTKESISVQMIDGAGFRVAGPNGIRFKVKISEGDYQKLTSTTADVTRKQLGVLIVPYFYLEQAQEAGRSDYHAFATRLDAIIYDSSADAPVNKLYEEDGAYAGNAVLGNVLFENTNLRFVGIGYYAEYDAEGQVSYSYVTGLNENDNARSVFEVAASAYADYKDNATVKDTLESILKDGFNQKAGASQGDEVDLSAVNLVLDKEDGDIAYVENATSVTVGASLQIGETSIAVRPVYASNNESIATVDKYGKVTFLQEGKVTVTASIFDRNASVTLNAYEAEEGTVQYFHKAFGADGVGIQFGGGSANLSVTSEKKHAESDGYSLKLETGASDFGKLRGIRLDSPYISDISSYKYFYFYVYTETEGAKLASFNNQYGTGQNLEAGKWTLCTVYKRSDGKFTNNSSDYYTVFPTENNAYAPTNITNAFINFSWTAENAVFYISPIRVATELPAVNMSGYVFEGEEFTVPTATMSDTTGLTQKVYIDGKLVEGATATVADLGTHEVKFTIFRNGKFIYEIVKNLIVVEKEEGVVQYFHRDFGTEGIKTRYSDCVSSFAIDTTIKHGTDEGSLKFTSTKSTWGIAGITLKAPYITDISSYKYFYFYVYTETAGAKFESINNIGWTGTKTLEAGKWTLITLVRPDGYTSYWGGDGNTVYIPDVKNGDTVATTDITNLYFNLSWTQGVGTFYISPIRVSNTAPGA